MDPDRRKFDSFVRDIEIFSKNNPMLYRCCVALLAFLGYFYIFGVIALLIGIVAGVVYVSYLLITQAHTYAIVAYAKLIIPVLIAMVGMLISIVRSLLIVIPKPEGPELTRETATIFFSVLDDISRKLKAPKFHHVLLSNEFNAEVAQVPSFGIIGFPVNYLIIGVPLLKCLTPEQFRAVRSRIGAYLQIPQRF